MIILRMLMIIIKIFMKNNDQDQHDEHKNHDDEDDNNDNYQDIDNYKYNDINDKDGDYNKDELILAIAMIVLTLMIQKLLFIFQIKI